MRHRLYITALLVLLTASVGFGAGSAVKSKVLELDIGTNSATDVSADFIGVDGYLYEIRLKPESGGPTGALSVVIISSDTNFANVTMLTETNVSGALNVRPRFDGNNVGGGVLTSDPPWLYMMVADTVRFACTTSSATGVTYKAQIKWYKPEN